MEVYLSENDLEITDEQSLAFVTAFKPAVCKISELWKFELGRVSLQEVQVMCARRYVLSIDTDNEFRSRCG